MAHELLDDALAILADLIAFPSVSARIPISNSSPTSTSSSTRSARARG